jgi:hypothetical protein
LILICQIKDIFFAFPAGGRTVDTFFTALAVHAARLQITRRPGVDKQSTTGIGLLQGCDSSSRLGLTATTPTGNYNLELS